MPIQTHYTYLMHVHGVLVLMLRVYLNAPSQHTCNRRRTADRREREREASEKVIVQLASVRCCWWLIFRLLLSVAYSAENQKIIPFPPFNPPPNSQRTHEPTTRDTDSSRNRQQQQHVMPLCETVARLGRQRHRRWCVSLHTLPRWEEDSH